MAHGMKFAHTAWIGGWLIACLRIVMVAAVPMSVGIHVRMRRLM